MAFCMTRFCYAKEVNNSAKLDAPLQLFGDCVEAERGGKLGGCLSMGRLHQRISLVPVSVQGSVAIVEAVGSCPKVIDVNGRPEW